MRPIKSIQVFFDAMLYPHGSWWCRMTITKTAQSTSYLSVTSCLLLLLHLLKVSVNRTPELKCKKQLCIFFLFGTERMNQTTDVKAPEPKSRKQTNPAVDMRLQCSARLNCCFLFSIESGGFERSDAASVPGSLALTEKVCLCWDRSHNVVKHLQKQSDNLFCKFQKKKKKNFCT